MIPPLCPLIIILFLIIAYLLFKVKPVGISFLNLFILGNKIYFFKGHKRNEKVLVFGLC